jgi:DNA-binding MarR family transcriptional regulator
MIDDQWLASMTALLTSVARMTHSTRLYEAMSAKTGFVARPYLVVLYRIHDLEPVRVSNVADAVELDRTTVSRYVTELTADGHIKRSADPNDGRVIVLETTTKGKELVERLTDAWFATLRDALDGWSTTDRAHLVRLLAKFETDLAAQVSPTRP